MMTPVRYILLAFFIVVSFHYILSFSHEEYGRATSLSNIKTKFGSTPGKPPYEDGIPAEYYDTVKEDRPSRPERKANAAIVSLARNGDIDGIVFSMKQMEDRFNKRYGYPYVFLNEQEFSEEFKSRVRVLTDAPVHFGLIPHDHWYQPDWIDEEKASAARDEMVRNQVIYGGACCVCVVCRIARFLGWLKTFTASFHLSLLPRHIVLTKLMVLFVGSVPYRNMCRYNSAFFFKHELLKNFRYYWRMEPDVRFFCDLNFDPFLLMQDQNKVYGFTLSLYEYEATIPTLWSAVREFTAANPGLVSPDNAMGFISDDGGETYNRCHFWSNFEIGDLDFWRGEAYTKFVEFLDEKGGFYYERWGDAPVHSIGAALFARKDQIHFFNEIGYLHNPFMHCPQGDVHTKGKCWCDPAKSFDREWYSCLNRYDGLFK
ncbi:glycosyltransferase family 15 protein [Thelephora terrestris]|uniref:Glycosyltransferase family 15 protein n=1 Tax=Thelephora terrestris TaxID=56493 RepID=A0A9P6H738_9AGAM|nr:glycosyltransferase family 15 protein [Thelephora terrestris]